MEINIYNTKTVEELQREFSNAFPFLKIELHAKPGFTGGIHGKKIITEPGKTIGDCRRSHQQGIIEIHSDTTIAELSKHLLEEFGLAIRISRKMGNNWIPTSLTESWTLAKQNEHGELLSFSKTGENLAAE
jgi:hypothetical protein